MICLLVIVIHVAFAHVQVHLKDRLLAAGELQAKTEKKKTGDIKRGFNYLPIYGRGLQLSEGVCVAM